MQADEKSALGESLSIAGTRPGGPADDRPEGPRQRHDNVLAYDGRVRAAACCLCRQQRRLQLRGAASNEGVRHRRSGVAPCAESRGRRQLLGPRHCEVRKVRPDTVKGRARASAVDRRMLCQSRMQSGRSPSGEQVQSVCSRGVEGLDRPKAKQSKNHPPSRLRQVRRGWRCDQA